jgi:ABC-type lipoprotein export system ATPase subunit
MIELKNVEKHYPDPETGKRVPILTIESISFKKNRQYALFGPSGIGKTTLLHLVSGLLKPENGTIVVDGVDISALSESKRDQYRATNIGYIFQTFNLIDGFTAIENVLLGMVFTGNGADKSKAEKALASVGLQDRMHYKPSQLSVGQQQRVCIARAIVNNPSILLADEPTGNLDPKATEEVLDILFNQAKDKILIVVTHEESVLKRFSDKIDMLAFSPMKEVLS